MTILEYFNNKIYGQTNTKGFYLVIRYVLTIIHVTNKSQIKLYATSLTYTSLLALVPFLAISFSILNIFGAGDLISKLLHKALEPTGDAGKVVAKYLLNFAQHADVGILGTLGVALLFYSMYSLIAQIENALNYIWQVDQQRNIKQKVVGYLGAMLIVVIATSVALALNINFLNTFLMKIIPTGSMFLGLFVFITKIVSILITSLVLAVFYSILPNTKVKFYAAFLGGLFCALLWIPLTMIFTKTIVASSSYSLIYSSFASVVILLIWLNILWLLFLAGSLLSYYAQYPSLLKKQSTRSLNPAELEYYAKQILGIITNSFKTNQGGVSLDKIISTTNLSRQQVVDIIKPFIDDKCLFKLENEHDLQYILGVDDRLLTEQKILEIVRGKVEPK